MKKIRLAIVRQKYRHDCGAERFISRALDAHEKRGCEINIITRQWSGEQRAKGLRQAINAVAATDRNLIVVGQDKHQHRYRALAQSLGCLSRVRFLGVLQAVLPCSHAVDALLLPTLYDPFPNVILEAMSCELPVILSQHVHRCA